MNDSLVVYAPNVHTGGGLVLLRALLDEWPRGHRLRAILDARAKAWIALPAQADVSWVTPTLASRLGAERRLASMTTATDTVLCFHGLPPLFRAAGRVVLFQQNRLLLGLMRLRDFPLRTSLRIAFERWISRAFRHHVNAYIVQTPTMARAITAWHGAAPSVTVMPFVPAQPALPRAQTSWDFVYVADGLPHKNHRLLLDAWILLANEGIRPRLALTLGARDALLAQTLSEQASRHELDVHNLGHIDHDAVLRLYASARALIFPSLGESFGLPLIEARQAGLPIVAPELDYVREVCEPVQTFDPLSAVSIARAVKRFVGQPEAPLAPGSAATFWSTLGLTPLEGPAS